MPGNLIPEAILHRFLCPHKNLPERFPNNPILRKIRSSINVGKMEQMICKWSAYFRSFVQLNWLPG
jgi:hypothetical protein